MNSCGADHLRKLLNRDRDVDILITAVTHLRALALKFLCGTRHDRDTANILRIDLCFLRVVSLDHSAEHLLWGLCAREMRELFVTIGLTVLDPRRTARGHHRESSTIFQAI